MDKSIDHGLAYKEVAAGNRVWNTGLDTYSTSITTVHYKDAEVATFSDTKRTYSTKIAFWRKIWPRKNIQPKAVIKPSRAV